MNNPPGWAPVAVVAVPGLVHLLTSDHPMMRLATLVVIGVLVAVVLYGRLLILLGAHNRVADDLYRDLLHREADTWQGQDRDPPDRCERSRSLQEQPRGGSG